MLNANFLTLLLLNLNVGKLFRRALVCLMSTACSKIKINGTKLVLWSLQIEVASTSCHSSESDHIRILEAIGGIL